MKTLVGEGISHGDLGDFDVVRSVHGLLLMRIPVSTVQVAKDVATEGKGKNLVCGEAAIAELQRMNGASHVDVNPTSMLARLIDSPGNFFFFGAANEKEAPFTTSNRNLTSRALADEWNPHTDFAVMQGDPRVKKKVAPRPSGDTRIGSINGLMAKDYWKKNINP